MIVEIIFDVNWLGEFFEWLKMDGFWLNWELYKLLVEVQQIFVIFEFEGLRVFLYLFDFILFFYQFEVVQKVVEKMNGKVILVDEVGFGKMVEVGLILKEYMICGLVKKILIFVLVLFVF